MKVFLVLNIIALITNLFGAMLFSGPPGLQYVLIYVTAIISCSIILASLFFVKPYKVLLFLGTFSLGLSVSTCLPLLLQSQLLSGMAMKELGTWIFSILIPNNTLFSLRYPDQPEYVEALVRLSENPHDAEAYEIVRDFDKRGPIQDRE